MSRSAARMLTTPWPPSVWMKSWMSSMGSPKNRSPPCSSICSSPRWMAPTLAALTLPYSVVNSLAWSPTCCSMARRSFRSSSARPSSSAILKTRLSTPAWVSLSASMRASSSGPMSLTVARTGWPCSPKTSHSVVGHRVRRRRRQAAVGQDPGHLVRERAGLADAGQVALHVGHEDRHADPAEALGQGLQRDGLAGAGGAGDQPVTVGQRRQQVAFDVAALGDEDGVGHGGLRMETVGTAGASLHAIPGSPTGSPTKRGRAPRWGRTGA